MRSAVLLTLVVLLAGCSGGDGGDDATGTSTPTPTTTSAPVEPEPVAPVVEPEPPRPDRPVWQTAQRPGEPVDVRRYDGDLLGLETRGVVRLDLEGRTVWRWSTPTRDDTFPFFVGDVPVTDHVVKGGGHEVSALDPATGRVVWSRPSNGSAAGDDGRVFAVSCTGRGPARACVQSAYDVRDGSLLWSTPLDAETDFSKVVLGRVLSKLAGDQDPARFVVVEAATGAVLASGLGRSSKEYLDYERAESALEPADPVSVRGDRDPADGCRTTVTLSDRAGAVRWSSPVTSAVKQGGRRERCGRLTARDAAGDVVVTGGTPRVVLLDGGTGEVRWTSDLVATTFGTNGAGVLLVWADDRLVGLDLRTGRELWAATDDIGEFRYSSVGGYVVGDVYVPGTPQTVALDLRTGEVVGRYRGRLEVVVRQRGTTSLLLSIDATRGYRSSYAYATLPRLR